MGGGGGFAVYVVMELLTQRRGGGGKGKEGGGGVYVVAGVHGGLQIDLGDGGLVAVSQAGDDVTLQSLAALVILDGDVALENNNMHSCSVLMTMMIMMNWGSSVYCVIADRICIYVCKRRIRQQYNII